MSVSLLPGIINAAMQSRNRVIAVWTPWIVVSRSLLMLLIATFMFEPAKLATNFVSASGARIFRGDTAAPDAGGCPPKAVPTVVTRARLRAQFGRWPPRASAERRGSAMPTGRAARRGRGDRRRPARRDRGRETPGSASAAPRAARRGTAERPGGWR